MKIPTEALPDPTREEILWVMNTLNNLFVEHDLKPNPTELIVDWDVSTDEFGSDNLSFDFKLVSADKEIDLDYEYEELREDLWLFIYDEHETFLCLDEIKFQ